MQVHIYNKDSITNVAEKLLKEYASQKNIWVLEGEMGTGKTTLTSAILSTLGYKGAVTSPTFSIVQEYALDSKDTVYHMDWYRVRSPEELWEIGIDEYLDSEDFILIEWPDLYLDELKEDALFIKIKSVNENTRELKAGTYYELYKST